MTVPSFDAVLRFRIEIYYRNVVKTTCHVYIVSNISRMLYVGVTNNMHRRIFEHKNKLVPGFSKKYNLHRLIYFEAFGDIRDPIAREKQIKGWLRAKKVALIEAQNPKWQDLAAGWFEAPKSGKETNMSPSKRVSS